MLATSLFAVLAALPAAFSAPQLAKRAVEMDCVQFQYGGPFTYFGSGGWISLYSNITHWDPDTKTTTFEQSRLFVIDGKVQPCGDCIGDQQFGFEVCQGPDEKGYDDFYVDNYPNRFYGHLLYRPNKGEKQCLSARRSAGNLDGIDLVPYPCSYYFDTVKTNGQYWRMTVGDGGEFQANLMQDIQGTGYVYGPSPDGKSLYELGEQGRPWTYYGFA